MTRVGTLRELWRFPVKSMQGGMLPSAQVTQRGLAGDRVWAMRDELRREVQWGKRLRIGAIEVGISAPTPRCGMTVQPQSELPHDKSILRTIVKDAGQNLGVGAHCLVAGRVRAGDAVELIDQQA